MFGLGVDFLQMLSFLLAPGIPWGGPLVSFQQSYRDYVTLDPLAMTPSLAASVLAAALLAVWTMVTLAAIVGRQMQQSQGIAFSLPAVRLLRLIAALMLTVFFLPLIKLLLYVLPCHNGHWLLFPAYSCFQSAHAIAVAVTLPTLLLLGPFAIAVGALVFQVSPTTATVLARPHNRIEVVYILGRMLLTLVAVTTREPLAVVPVFLLVTLPVLSLLYLSPPFYRRVPSVARIACFSALSAAALWTLLNLAVEPMHATDDVAVGVFIGFWVALVLGGLAGAVAGNRRYMRLAYAMIGGKGNGQEGNPVDALPDVRFRMLSNGFGSVEIMTRFLQTHHKTWHVRRANAIFRAEIKRRPKSARLRATYVIFLMHYAMGGAIDNPFEVAHQQMDEAKHLPALPDTSYILFTIRRSLAELQQGVVHGAGSRGDMTTLDHAFLRKQERRAQLHANAASEWISRFWVAISLGHAEDAVLRTIAVKIDENEKEALDAYEMLLRRFPSSVRVTRSFGAFLANIAHDKEGADWAFGRAENLEEALANKNRRKMESKMPAHKDKDAKEKGPSKNLDTPSAMGRRLSSEIPGLVETPQPSTPAKKPSGSSSQYTAPSSMVSDGEGTTDLFLELNNDQRQLSLGQLAPSTRILMSALRCVVCYFLFFIIPSMCLVAILGFTRIENAMDNGLLDVRSSLLATVVGDTWRVEKAGFGHDPLVDSTDSVLSRLEFEELLIDSKLRIDELGSVNRKQRVAESKYVNHNSEHLDRILLDAYSFIDGKRSLFESDMWSVMEEIQRQASVVVVHVAAANNVTLPDVDVDAAEYLSSDFVSEVDAYLDVMYNALRGPLMQTTVIARQIFREQLDNKSTDLFLPMVLTPAVHCVFLLLLLVWVIVAWIRVRHETRVIGLCRTIPKDVADAELVALHSLDQASKLDEAGALYDVNEDEDHGDVSHEQAPKQISATAYYDGALRRVVRDANVTTKVIDEKAAVLLFIVVSATTVIILLGLAVLTQHPEFRTATHAEVMRQRVSLLDRIASDLVIPDGPLLEVTTVTTSASGERVTRTEATTSALGNRTAIVAEFERQFDILSLQLDILLRGRSEDEAFATAQERNATGTDAGFADADAIVVVDDSIPALFDNERQIEWLDSVGGAAGLRRWMDVLARIPITADADELRRLYFHIDFPTKVDQFDELVILLEQQAKDRFALLTTMAQSALFPCLFIALSLLYVVFVRRLPRKLLREVRLARRLMDLVPDSYASDARLEQIFAFVKGQHVVLRHGDQDKADDGISLEQGFKLMAENSMMNRSMPGRQNSNADSVVMSPQTLEALIHTARSGSPAPNRAPSDSGSTTTGRTGGYNLASFGASPAPRRSRTRSYSSLSSSLALMQGHCTVDQHGVLVAADERAELLLNGVPGYGVGKQFPGWPAGRRGTFSFTVPGGPNIAPNLEATVRETGSSPHLFLVILAPPMPSPGRQRLPSTTTSSMMRSTTGRMTRISEGDSSDVDEVGSVLVFDIASLDVHYADREAAALCSRISLDKCNLDELFLPPIAADGNEYDWSEPVTRLFAAQQHGVDAKRMSPLLCLARAHALTPLPFPQRSSLPSRASFPPKGSKCESSMASTAPRMYVWRVRPFFPTR